MQILSRPLQSNFLKDEPLSVEAYHTLFSKTGIHFLNEGNFISRDNYDNGYTLFAFDFIQIYPLIAQNIEISWNTGTYD